MKDTFNPCRAVGCGWPGKYLLKHKVVCFFEAGPVVAQDNKDFSRPYLEAVAMRGNKKQGRGQVNWGPKLFYGVIVLLLVFFWWLLIYSHGIDPRH